MESSTFGHFLTVVFNVRVRSACSCKSLQGQMHVSLVLYCGVKIGQISLFSTLFFLLAQVQRMLLAGRAALVPCGGP